MEAIHTSNTRATSPSLEVLEGINLGDIQDWLDVKKFNIPKKYKTTNDIAKLLDIKKRTLHHHLRMIIDRDKETLKYFPVKCSTSIKNIPHYDIKKIKEYLDDYLEEPPIGWKTAKDVYTMLNIPRPTFNRLIRKLIDDKIIEQRLYRLPQGNMRLHVPFYNAEEVKRHFFKYVTDIPKKWKSAKDIRSIYHISKYVCERCIKSMMKDHNIEQRVYPIRYETQIANVLHYNIDEVSKFIRLYI